MRILIADDNAAIRRGMVVLLSELTGAEVCGEAANVDETLHKAHELRPNLILLDVSMPGGNGLDTARKLRQESPEVKILIISQHDIARLTPASLEAGADGCIDKARIGIDLIPIIRKMLEG